MMNQIHKVCTSCGYVGEAGYQIQILKFRDVKCPKCERLSMVSLRSTEGQFVLAQGVGQPHIWNDASESISIDR